MRGRHYRVEGRSEYEAQSTLATAGECLPCFTPEQWREWHLAARQVKRLEHRDTTSHPCMDCTPEHQARMLAQEKCAHPTVYFARKYGEGLTGIRPPPLVTEPQPAPLKKPRKPYTKRSTAK
jgi:hypothetical protein